MADEDKKLEKVVIGEYFPFVKPTLEEDPNFQGDDVHSAFDKFNANMELIEEGGIGGGGGGNGGSPSDGGYIDANPDYTQFFAGESLLGWSVQNGTGTVPEFATYMDWVANANSNVYRVGDTIDGKRYTHVVVEIELLTGGLPQDIRITTQTPTRAFNFNTHFALPTNVTLVPNEIRFVTFQMDAISDWNVGETNGLRFRMSLAPATYKIHSIRLVGPDSSLVQLAAIQAKIEADLAEAAEARARAEADLAEARRQAAEASAQAAEQFKISANEFANEAQQYALDSAEYTEVSEYHSLVAEAEARFALYLETAPGAAWDFNDGTVMGFTPYNSTIANVANRLRVTHSTADGGVYTPVPLNLSGNIYSKMVVRVQIIDGTIPDLSETRIFYTTEARPNYGAQYYLRPIGYEKGKINENNFGYFMFDADLSPGGALNDWKTSTIRALRFDLANVTGLVYDIDYFYILGTDAAYPYKQAQAAATSALNAATSETEALQYATASQTSATNAATSESNAATSAGQASTSATDANTSAATATTQAGLSAGSANTAGQHSANAAISETNAASSASDADASAAEAKRLVTLSAKSSPGIPLTLNPIFMEWDGTLPNGYANNSGAGATTIIKNTANAIYSVNALEMVAGTGNLIITSRTSNSNGLMQSIDAAYYVLDIDFELVSGSLTGSGLIVRRYASDNTYVGLNYNFSDAGNVTSSGGNRYRVQKVIAVPPTPTGKTFSEMDLLVVANWSSFGTLTAKRLRFHKVLLRTATSEEIVTGNITDEVAAIVQQEMGTIVDDVGDIKSKYSIKVDNNGYVSGYGLISTVNNGVPLAEMTFLVDKFKVVQPGGAGNAATPKQMFAVGPVNGTNTLVVNGNMIADGSISARSALFGVGGNWFDNADISAGTYYWRGTTVLPLSIDTWSANQVFPRPLFYSAANQSAAISNQNVGPATADGLVKSFAVTGGSKYEFSAYFLSWKLGITLHVNFANADGTSTSWPIAGTSGQGGGGGTAGLAMYKRVGGIVTAPSWAVTATPYFRFDTVAGQTGGDCRVTRPYFSEALPYQTELSNWAVGGQTLINGGAIVANSVTATQINVTNLAAINANLGHVTAGSMNVNNRFVLGTDGGIVIRSATSGQRLEITSSLISVYDGNGTLRVRMGIW